jgi:hypothetical protein
VIGRELQECIDVGFSINNRKLGKEKLLLRKRFYRACVIQLRFIAPTKDQVACDATQAGQSIPSRGGTLSIVVHEKIRCLGSDVVMTATKACDASEISIRSHWRLSLSEYKKAFLPDNLM